MKWVAIAVLAILLVSGCSQQASVNSDVNANNAANAGTDNRAGTGTSGNARGAVDAMGVANGDTVKIEYIGKLTDGTVFDKSEGRGPLEFVAGSGQMIKGFDEAVIGMKLNEEKEVTIPPEKAYGAASDKGQTVVVPVASIGGEGNVTVGMPVSTRTGQTGTIIDISSGSATIEFKHPLSGKTLTFWIKVVDIRKAK